MRYFQLKVNVHLRLQKAKLLSIKIRIAKQPGILD